MKKHIPRRTFLRGAGVTLALPLLDAMMPADRLAQTAAAAEDAVRRHLLSARHGARPLGAEGRRRASRQAAVHPRVARAGQESVRRPVSGLWSKSAEPPEGTTGSDHWVAAAYLTGIKPRKTAAADATVGSPTIDQIIAQQDRRRHAAAVAAARRRGSELELQQLRRGLQLLVHQLDLVDGLPTPSTEPLMRTAPLPMELNPQVVFERLFGSGGTPELRAARLVQRRSILDALVGELTSLESDLGAGRSPRRQPVHRRDPRDRAAPRAGRESLARRPGVRSAAGRAGTVRRAHQASLRPAGAGVQGGHHARGDGARRARSHQPRLSRSRRVRSSPRAAPASASTAARITRTTRRRSSATRRSTAITCRRWRTSRRSCARSPKATARCSINSLILYGTQHGQLEPAPALRRAAHSGRRRRRQAERQPPPRVRAENRDDRQPAAQRPGHVRHPQGRAGRQHRQAREALRDETAMRGSQVRLLACGACGALCRDSPPAAMSPTRHERRQAAPRLLQKKADVNAPQADGACTGPSTATISRRSICSSPPGANVRAANSRRRDAAGDGVALRKPPDRRSAAEGGRRRRSSAGPNGETMLMFAARNGRVDLIKRLRRGRRRRERARGASRHHRADVGGRAAASRCGEGAAGRRRRSRRSPRARRACRRTTWRRASTPAPSRKRGSGARARRPRDARTRSRSPLNDAAPLGAGFAPGRAGHGSAADRR